jgi:hypothetical protein
MDPDLISMYSDISLETESNDIIKRHNTNMFSKAVLKKRNNCIIDDKGRCVEFRQYNRYISLTINGEKKVYDIFTILDSGVHIQFKKTSLWSRIKNKFNLSR